MKGAVPAECITSSFELEGCPSFCKELTHSLSHRWSQAEATGGIAAAKPFDIKDSLQEEKKGVPYTPTIYFFFFLRGGC